MIQVFLVVSEQRDVWKVHLATQAYDLACEFGLAWIRVLVPSIDTESISIYAVPVDPKHYIEGHQLTELRSYSNYDDGGLKLEPGVWMSGE
jgi:hypothetical protein